MNYSRIILHIDMNSYFASVEQQANPFLRGKPVAVCAYLSPKGCIIASSMEAKKLGIKTGMRVCDAQRIDPKVVVIENEPAKYRSVTEKIFSILADYTDTIEPYSIDEAFLDLTGWVRSKSNVWAIHESSLQSAYIIALEIKGRIMQEVGEWLKCSIGISQTRYLAKLASDIAEKNSILVIEKDGLDKIYSKLRLTQAWGIKHKMAWRLFQLGIFTLRDLKNYPVTNLMQVFGAVGYYLWANVNGIEVEGVRPQAKIQPKSFGHSYALANKTTNVRYLRAILMKLCEKTGKRLRSAKMEAQNITALMTYVNIGERRRILKTPVALYDTMAIFQAADKILLSRPPEDKARMLAVRVTRLAPLS